MDHDEALDGTSRLRFDPRHAQVILVEWEDGSLTPYVGPARYGSDTGIPLRISRVHVGAPIHFPAASKIVRNKFLDALLQDM